MWELRPPHLMKWVPHMLGGTSLILQGELSYGVLQELQNHYDDPKPACPLCHRTNKRLSPRLTS